MIMKYRRTFQFLLLGMIDANGRQQTVVQFLP